MGGQALGKVLEYAERMLETAKAMKQSLDSDRAKVGRIRIGVMDTVIHTWMSALVAELTGLTGRSARRPSSRSDSTRSNDSRNRPSRTAVARSRSWAVVTRRWRRPPSSPASRSR